MRGNKSRTRPFFSLLQQTTTSDPASKISYVFFLDRAFFALDRIDKWKESHASKEPAKAHQRRKITKQRKIHSLLLLLLLFRRRRRRRPTAGRRELDHGALGERPTLLGEPHRARLRKPFTRFRVHRGYPKPLRHPLLPFQAVGERPSEVRRQRHVVLLDSSIRGSDQQSVRVEAEGIVQDVVSGGL